MALCRRHSVKRSLLPSGHLMSAVLPVTLWLVWLLWAHWYMGLIRGPVDYTALVQATPVGLLLGGEGSWHGWLHGMWVAQSWCWAACWCGLILGWVTVSPEGSWGWCQSTSGWILGWLWGQRDLGMMLVCWGWLEGGFQNDACQHQYLCRRMSSPEWLLPVSVTPGEVSVASKRLSKWAILTQIPAKYWVCTGTWIMWDYSVPFRNLCFLHPLVLPYTSPVILQSHIFWGLVFGVGPPSWEAQCGPQTPPSLERSFAVVVIFSFVDCLPEGVVVWVRSYCVSTIPAHLIVVPSLYL